MGAVFFFMFLGGIAWIMFREPDVTRIPGPIMIVGFVGWLAMKWRIWFYTDEP